MPSTRITLASNANQSIRTIVLLSDPGTVQNILDLSRNKLRIKKPKRLFVGGSGRELLGDEDVRVLVDDWYVMLFGSMKKGRNVDLWGFFALRSTILVSAGEDYIGNESMTSPPSTYRFSANKPTHSHSVSLCRYNGNNRNHFRIIFHRRRSNKTTKTNSHVTRDRASGWYAGSSSWWPVSYWM